MTLEEIIDAIPCMTGADAPHCHSPTTAGDLAAQLLRLHPRVQQATRDEVQALVLEMGAPFAATHRPYMIGGEPGGNLGGPGTWASVGSGGCAALQISGTMPLVYPADDVPEDPTLLDRIAEEIRSRVEAMGRDPDIVRLVSARRGAFAGDDVVTYETPATESGTDTFAGFYSHNPRLVSPSTLSSLEHAAASIVAHHEHTAEIRRRIALLRDRAVKRFAAVGCEVGETTLVTIDTNGGELERVNVVTPITILDHTLRPTRVMLQMSEPHPADRSLFDGYRMHYRDHRRRLALLAGREPIDAYTMCPAVARSYRGLTGEEARRKASDVRNAMLGKEADDDKKGISFSEGRLSDTIRLGDGITFRNRTLMAHKAAYPQTVLQAMIGRPLTDLISDARIEGYVVKEAVVDAKGRLKVTTHPVEAVPLRHVLEALEASS